SSPTDVYAVGSSGILMHYNGSAWAALTSGPSEQFNGMWGRSVSDIYAVGPPDSVWHYNGIRWSAQLVEWPDLTTPINRWLAAVWGSAPDNLIAVGGIDTCRALSCDSGAVVARYCGGSSWTLEAPQSPALNAIWGSSASDIYAVGGSGTILRRDGPSWIPQPVLTRATLTDVWGTADGTVFAV